MQLYMWWIIIGIVLLILELLSPTLFFLNLGLACLLTAIFAYLGFSQIIQAIIFLFSAGLLLLFVKPVLKKFYKSNSTLADKYIGSIATVNQKVDKLNGRIDIYGEQWEARALNDEVFELGQQVKIVKRESLILYVEKL